MNFEINKNIEGWFCFEEKYDQILKLYDSGVFVEIGPWQGKGTSYMVQRIKEENKNIQFYVIDTFKGTDGLPVGKIAKELGGDVYHIFEKNMKKCNLFDDINILKESSLESYKKFKDESIDLVYIDGDHRYEGTKSDLNNFFPKVKKGGFMIIDYYKFPPVKKAVDEFCLNNTNISYTIDGYDWVANKI